LKFTDAGKVSLAIRPAPERGGSTLAFAVHDTGIGIVAEKQKLIFEAFQQADGTISGKYGGTGLGLTISREIAHLLGGSIEVVSAPDKGSTFTLLLPTTYAGADLAWRDNFITNHQKFESKIPPLPENATFAGAKVLLVDDDARNLYALRTVLEARGITVRHAENGRIALEVLHSEPEIELVLMDTMMPEMDGLAATRAIREIKQFQSLPIISLTARAMKDDCEKAFAAGATDYVAKPVDPEKLLAVVHFWCRNGDRTPLAASSTVEVAQ
jgi:CheY-like chemotaxis protein